MHVICASHVHMHVTCLWSTLWLLPGTILVIFFLLPAKNSSLKVWGVAYRLPWGSDVSRASFTPCRADWAGHSIRAVNTLYRVQTNIHSQLYKHTTLRCGLTGAPGLPSIPGPPGSPSVPFSPGGPEFPGGPFLPGSPYVTKQ